MLERTGTPRVVDLTVPQREALIERAVLRALDKFASGDYDPDEGLTLKPEVAARLEKSIREMKQGKRGIPHEEVWKRLGLE